MDRGVTDCIAAIATPPGQGAIGIIRLSGPAAPSILNRVFKSKTPVDHFDSHRLYLGTLMKAGEPLDHAMAVWMKAPHSFTGEDCVELHCHGGSALLTTVLSVLLTEGARMARPGEFSERAFLNGKIDLTQAEAICDLIQAKSDKALSQSFRHLAGALSHKIDALKTELIAVKAHLDASIDFPEEDITPDTANALQARLHHVEDQITALLQSYERGRILREGLRLVIIGKPNVGKSSLLNAFLGENRAIVHETAGTTRDFIEESFVLHGLPIRIVDTAGIREYSDQIEAEGIHRTLSLIEQADLILALFDGSRLLDEEDYAVIQTLTSKVPSQKIIWIQNKTDLPCEWESLFPIDGTLLPLSLATQEGLGNLEAAIIQYALGSASADSDTCTITHVRHRDSLLLAQTHLRAAALQLHLPECAASDIQHAIDALKEITGEITHDDILDKLFREFCIGK